MKKFLIQDGSNVRFSTDGDIISTNGQIPIDLTRMLLNGMVDLHTITPKVISQIDNQKYKISAYLKKEEIYGFDIDESNPDPYTSVTYTDGALNFTPLSVNSSGVVNYGSWTDTFILKGNKPCILKNGVRQYYLNPNDYTKKEDGTASDITSGNAGDVMAEFAQTWYKFDKVGNIIKFRISPNKIDDTWCSNAFVSEGDYTTIKPYMYVGAYNGYNLSGKLRSLSGYAPTVSNTIATFRGLAQANGSGYTQTTLSKYSYILALLILVSKSINIQKYLGAGRSLNTNTSAINTGTMNNKGQFWGNQNGIDGVKAFHIENFWGNIWQMMDGLGLSNYVYKYRNIGPYADTYNTYLSGGNSPSGSGWIKNCMANNNIGILPLSIGGSDITYYSDYLYTSDSNRICLFGGYWSYGSYDGPFYLYLYYASSYYSTYVGSRLSFS